MQAPGADDLLFGAYRREGDGRLVLAILPQAEPAIGLHLIRRDGECLHFRYQDQDCSVDFVALSNRWGLPRAPEKNRRLTIVLGPGNAGAVTHDYGLWRRLTWFLLDALLTWMALDSYDPPADEFEIKIVGGWRSSGWDPQVLLSVFHFSESGHDAGRVPARLPLQFPLRAKAPSARFLPGCSVTASLTPDMVRGMTRDAFGDALGRVPRFELNDGSVLFFSEVRPHVGPEYAPGSSIGFFDGTAVAFSSCRHMFRDCAAQSLDSGRFGPDPAAVERLYEGMFYAALVAHLECGEDPGCEAAMVHPDWADQSVRFRGGQTAMAQMPYSSFRTGPSALRLNRVGLERVSTPALRPRAGIFAQLRSRFHIALVRLSINLRSWQRG